MKTNTNPPLILYANFLSSVNFEKDFIFCPDTFKTGAGSCLAIKGDRKKQSSWGTLALSISQRADF